MASDYCAMEVGSFTLSYGISMIQESLTCISPSFPFFILLSVSIHKLQNIRSYFFLYIITDFFGIHNNCR